MTNRIVVARDDDSRVRESIARLATSAGLEVEVYPSAEEMLSSGVLARAGCLITDIRMPGMDDLELQWLARTAHPTLPVIQISALSPNSARACLHPSRGERLFPARTIKPRTPHEY